MRIEISGQAVPARLGSVTVDDRLDERSIANFTIVDRDGIYNFEVGQPIEISEDNGELLWTGFIENPVRESIRGAGSGFFWSISGKDNHYLADKRILVAAYQNQCAGAIVRDIVDTL